MRKSWEQTRSLKKVLLFVRSDFSLQTFKNFMFEEFFSSSDESKCVTFFLETLTAPILQHVGNIFQGQFTKPG